MCGIFCNISRDNIQTTCNHELLKNRGPDAFNVTEISLDGDWKASFAGSTLWTQGLNIKSQPLAHSNGSILLWNGDKYSDLHASSNCTRSINENDSEDVLYHLVNGNISYFEQITGPYAFIFYNSKKNELWFGRDVLGRHSLLWLISQKSIILSSVAEHKSLNVLTEVPSCGLFKILLTTCDISIELFPWSHMIPKEITSDVSFSVKDLLYHNILGRCTDYHWTIMKPSDDEPTLLNFDEGPEVVFPHFLEIPYYLITVNKLKDLLFKSVQRRVITKPDFCKNCLLKNVDCKHAKIGILFSGGLDSAILALITDNFVPEEEPIDLFNVSFARDSKQKFDNVPDRKTGKRTLEELKLLCPKRCWNFVEINISQEELKHERHNHIVYLIYPLSSVLDDSLGCAVWFAARGKGLVNEQPYTSPARVVLLGMGADEMFGGYSRHRATFRNNGWKGLTHDLYNDLRHIGERNLGRDNRVVSDHGRVPRMPYLDEEFVALVDSLPTWFRCCLNPKIARGIGDKLVLRLLAWKLGLRSAASLPKKALQFGSHIANPKDKGHVTSKNLMT
ncbi:asparagine synthetase domain-containing protein 1 [Halyomorpha halys]|uniref:asparagine synthetase domain-containing protein 1 n=1 Tax=Halyomorpha halys TaxID=286706 RepID=UPI0006D5009C|nr:asparagine synthetase domain-containing protein 1 [Halyomorpha halys]